MEHYLHYYQTFGRRNISQKLFWQSRNSKSLEVTNQSIFKVVLAKKYVIKRVFVRTYLPIYFFLTTLELKPFFYEYFLEKKHIGKFCQKILKLSGEHEKSLFGVIFSFAFINFDIQNQTRETHGCALSDFNRSQRVLFPSSFFIDYDIIYH